MVNNRTKLLTESQARRCENARHPRCRCRCGGRFHGARRIALDAPREDFAALGQSDPHFLPVREARCLRRHTARNRSMGVLRRAMANELLPGSVREATRAELERLERMEGNP
jgi:hypothetical protein